MNFSEKKKLQMQQMKQWQKQKHTTKEKMDNARDYWNDRREKKI